MNSKTFLRYVSQSILGMLAVSCYILVDTFFVSMALGASGLAALNLSIAVFSAVTGLGQLIGIGGGTDFALRRGEGKQPEKSFHAALCFGACVSAALVLAGLLFAEPISLLLGAEETTRAMTITYVRVTLLFSPVFILNAILRSFALNDGAPRLAMLSMLVSSLANIALDYLFMFPLKMGMFGAVFATGLSACLAVPVLLSHFRRSALRLTRALPSPHEFGRLLSYGLSALIGELASAVALLTFNLLLMRETGYIGVAAYGVIANAALVAASIFTGLGQGVQPLASSTFGAQDHAGMRRLLRYSAAAVAVLSLLIFGLVLVFAEPIVGLFNHERSAALTAIAVPGLRVYFIGYLFAGVSIAACSLLSAVNAPVNALAVSLLRSSVLLVPAAVTMAHAFGVTGVWASFAATEAVCCALALALMGRQMKETNI